MNNSLETYKPHLDATQLYLRFLLEAEGYSMQAKLSQCRSRAFLPSTSCFFTDYTMIPLILQP